MLSCLVVKLIVISGRVDVRVRIAVQSQQIHINTRDGAIVARGRGTSQFPIFIQRQTRSICILVGVEKDIGAVVFVIAIEKLTTRTDRNYQPLRLTYSLAHRYGSSARIFARAHFDRSKGDVVLGDILRRYWRKL
jgi:hypothetical protein